jgi:hypothetical protein
MRKHLGRLLSAALHANLGRLPVPPMPPPPLQRDVPIEFYRYPWF